MNVVVAGTGEVVKRVASEKANPLGDVLWAGSEAMLASKKELFMEYVSKEDPNMMEEFRNTTKLFTPAFSDPTAFQSLVVMLYDMGNGDPFSKEAWDYCDKFLKQLNGKMMNSSSQVYKGVAGGEYIVGLTWEDPAATLVKSGAPVEVVFPKEGALYAPQSVQIIKNCKHPENAKKFVDYMLSDKIQNLVGTTLTVRPLRKNAKLADYMTPASKIKIAPKFNEKWVSENKEKFTKEFTKHLEKSM